MDTTRQVYINLQKHLNSQPVGFPATRSGAEINVLKHIFTPREAEIATYLDYRPEPVETIFSRSRHLVESPEKLETILESIVSKGGIESKTKEGKTYYCNAPLVVGMYELQLGRLTPEFIKDFNTYTTDRKFGIEFLSTELPQMRTIPIEKSIQPQARISTFDEVKTLLNTADEPFVIVECICRKKKLMEGESCKVTNRKETCLAMGSLAQSVLKSEFVREISRDEAISILENNQKQGLVLQPSNTEKADFICSCCGCCCGMLNIHQILPKPLEFWATNFFATVDINACDGCGVCVKRCQVGAANVLEKKITPATIDLNLCLGCGVCVPSCPKKALSLQKKPDEIKPPKTREDLYDIIMSKKKNGWQKFILTIKLLIDIFRTGRTGMIKSPK